MIIAELYITPFERKTHTTKNYSLEQKEVRQQDKEHLNYPFHTPSLKVFGRQGRSCNLLSGGNATSFF